MLLFWESMRGRILGGKSFGLFHKTSLANKLGLFQLVWLILNQIKLTISQINWNKPGLFGKLVSWNSPLKSNLKFI